MRPRRFALVAPLAPLAFAACSGEPVRPSTPPPAARSVAVPSYESPARWDYHPPAPDGPLTSRARTGDGRLLYGAPDGARWLYDPRSGEAQSTPHRIPDPIVAITRGEDGAWIFVGPAGTTYAAREPLGRIERASAPPEPLAQVSAAGGVLVGVTAQHRLLRSTDGGASWTAPHVGDARFVAAAIDDGGHALALSLPERLWTSADAAGTFARAPDAPRVGATTVGIDGAGRLAAEGPIGIVAWSPGATPAFSRGSQPMGAPHLELDAEIHPGPDGVAAAHGRAVLVGDRYVGAIASRGDDDRKSFALVSGKLGARLSTRAVAGVRGCTSLAIGAFGGVVELGCITSRDRSETKRLRMLRSEDGGASFREDGGGLVARGDVVWIAVGDAGAVLVGGACRPSGSRASCDDPTPLRRVREGAGTRWAPVALEPIDDATVPVAFDATGRVGYLLAHRLKDRALAAFVTHDGGLTFRASPLDAPTDGGEASGDDASDEAVPVSLAPGDDGVVSAVLRQGDRTLVLALDAGGEMRSLSRAPDGASVGTSGARALAVAPGLGEAWESLDAGATWQPIALGANVRCEAEGPCAVDVRCGPAGCLVGSSLARLGWRGQRETDEPVVASPSVATAPPPRTAPRSLTCRLAPGAFQSVAGMISLPTASDADRGATAWSEIALDPKHAAVSAVHGVGGPKPRVEVVPLLRPLPHASGVAWRISPQVEGMAAIRARPLAGSLRDVELAWDDRFADHVGRARLADAGAFSDRLLQDRGGGEPAIARFGLVSITSGGLFFRPRADDLAPDSTYFFPNGGGPVERSGYVAWPERDLAGAALETNGDEVRVGRRSVPVAMIGSSVLLRARPGPTGFTFDPLAVAPADDAASGTHVRATFTYVRGAPALEVLVDDGERPFTDVLPFRADGEPAGDPIAAATQRDLPDPPRACGAADRAATPRVLAPALATTRRRVRVLDTNGEPFRTMTTGTAIAYGTRAEPCVAVYEAVATDERGRGEETTALLPLGDLEHAWIFRADDGGVAWRTMRCAFDAAP